MSAVRIDDHVEVFRSPDIFAAWPFNGGLWQFPGDEIVVGFFRGPCDYRTPKCTNHADVDRQFVTMRSFDGGRTWPAGELRVVYEDRPSYLEKLKTVPVAYQADQALDASPDGYCLAAGFGIPLPDAQRVAHVTISTDRGRTWPYVRRVSAGTAAQGFQHLSVRPSTLRRDDGLMLLFAHGSRSGGEAGSPTAGGSLLVYASDDGGASWGVFSEFQPPIPGLMAIMPSPVLLRDGTILLAVRRQWDGYSAYTEIYASTDGGMTFSYRGRANRWGSPATLTLLPDGRVLCVFGYRRRPFGIRATLSDDSGRTWGPDVVIRDDGGSWDVGYPRTLLRPDGSLLTLYYFNRKDDPVQLDGGVRHIVATHWRL